MQALTIPSPNYSGSPSEIFCNATMSRKRSLSVSESPRAKRHLNAALAAEMQTLRISPSFAQNFQPQRNAFGAPVNSSPFLTSSPSFRAEPPTYRSDDPKCSRPPPGDDSRFGFGTDFAAALSDSRHYQHCKESREVPQVFSPASESSLSIASDDGNMSEAEDQRYAPPVLLETNSDDVIVEDLAAPLTSENRVVVYRPPVNSSPKTLAQLNASLPDGRYVFRNPRTDEWIVQETHNDRMKRKMALVPWRGDSKKVCNTMHGPARVIPMPWHSPDIATPDNDVETMEIEELSEP